MHTCIGLVNKREQKVGENCHQRECLSDSAMNLALGDLMERPLVTGHMCVGVNQEY